MLRGSGAGKILQKAKPHRQINLMTRDELNALDFGIKIHAQRT